MHSLLAYGDKMLHDKFDGSKGFAIDGGVKDATYAMYLAVLLYGHSPPVAHVVTSVNSRRSTTAPCQ